MNDQPKKPNPCPYCGKVGWTWTIENGQNVARAHNPERCFSNPQSSYYPIYKNFV